MFSIGVDFDDDTYGEAWTRRLTFGQCSIKANESLLLAYGVGNNPYEVSHEYVDSFGWGDLEPEAVKRFAGSDFMGESYLWMTYDDGSLDKEGEEEEVVQDLPFFNIIVEDEDED